MIDRWKLVSLNELIARNSGFFLFFFWRTIKPMSEHTDFFWISVKFKTITSLSCFFAIFFVGLYYKYGWFLRWTWGVLHSNSSQGAPAGGEHVWDHMGDHPTNEGGSCELRSPGAGWTRVRIQTGWSHTRTKIFLIFRSVDKFSFDGAILCTWTITLHSSTPPWSQFPISIISNKLTSHQALIEIFPLTSRRRFSRERRVFSRSLVSKETQTIVSAWEPVGVARIRARSCADRWAPPPRSRCAARSRPRRESSAPWKRAKGRASSPATSASRRWSCACSRASPSSSPACYNTSSWSEGNLTIGSKEKVKSQKKRTFRLWKNRMKSKQTLEMYF